MAADERYDIIVVGGGHNGTTIAAYLAKCGTQRLHFWKIGGTGWCPENTEAVAGAEWPLMPSPIMGGSAGVGATGAVEVWLPHGPSCRHPEYRPMATGFMTGEGMYQVDDTSAMGFGKIAGYLGTPPFTQELLRATFLVPSASPEVDSQRRTSRSCRCTRSMRLICGPRNFSGGPFSTSWMRISVPANK